MEYKFNDKIRIEVDPNSMGPDVLLKYGKGYFTDVIPIGDDVDSLKLFANWLLATAKVIEEQENE